MRVACQADAFTPSITAATNLAAAAATLRRIISKSNDSHITETIAGIPFLLDTGKSRYWEENFPIFGEVLAKTVSHLQKKNTGQLFLVFFFFPTKKKKSRDKTLWNTRTNDLRSGWTNHRCDIHPVNQFIINIWNVMLHCDQAENEAATFLNCLFLSGLSEQKNPPAPPPCLQSPLRLLQNEPINRLHSFASSQLVGGAAAPHQSRPQTFRRRRLLSGELQPPAVCRVKVET